MTEIQQHTMSVRDAEKLTERIRYMAMSVRDGVEKLQKLVSDAQEGQAHLALGYPSWTAYIAEVMGDEPLQLRNREERREVVSWLAGQGMSTRAIAPVVGAARNTVMSDLREVAQSEPPASPASPAEPTFDDTPDWDQVGATYDVATRTVTPGTVTGMDGKTYSRPEPKEEPVAPRKRPRRPIHETARGAAMSLRDATDKLGVEFDDDRFPAIAEELAPQLRNQLAYVIETCQGYLDALNPNKE